MSVDKPVSLTERCHVERCYCHSSDCEGLFCVDETCVCLKGEKAHDPRCVALEAEAKALEAERDKAIDSLVQQSSKWGELTRRNAALEEVLRSAPEPPNFDGLANLGVYPWTWAEHYREWHESLAAALADEPRKESDDAPKA